MFGKYLLSKRIFNSAKDILLAAHNSANIKNSTNNKLFAFISIAIFLIGLIYSVKQIKLDLMINLNILNVSGLLTLILITLFINTIRLYINARALKSSLNFYECLKISTYSSAINMIPFPLPGGLLYRASNLINNGATSNQVGLRIFINYLLILFTSLLLGIGLFSISSDNYLFFFYTILFLYSLVAFYFVSLSTPIFGIAICIIELLAIAVDAFRIIFCFSIIGFNIELFQGVLLTISAILGSTISIIPAGLGVREIIAALIAPFIDISPESAFIAISVNRIFAIAFFIPVAYFLAFRFESKS